jgi:FeS assembly SUF system regulator
MIRISKLTDYAMVILSQMGKDPNLILQTGEIAKMTFLAKPTVSKILKQLVNKKILLSQRGATGGYKLASNAEDISLASIIIALEGQVAITECNSDLKHCSIANQCPITSPWLKINRIIYNSLAAYKLSDLVAATLEPKHCANKKIPGVTNDDC